MSEYELVLELTSDDPAYAHGFEMGRLWESLKRRPKKHQGMLHAVNEEQVRVMARRLGYRVEAQQLEDGWMSATLQRME